jgi:peptide deformylase
VRSIRIYGSPNLREVSREIDPAAEAGLIADLLPDMNRVLAVEEGLGLAAPQVGENVRVFILEPSILPSICGHRVFINPRLSISGPPARREEGCLSLPGIWETVTRPSMVTVEAMGPDGLGFRLELAGLAARAVQHEYDHLDGILFVDRLSSLKRRLLRSTLSRLAGGG